MKVEELEKDRIYKATEAFKHASAYNYIRPNGFEPGTYMAEGNPGSYWVQLFHVESGKSFVIYNNEVPLTPMRRTKALLARVKKVYDESAVKNLKDRITFSTGIYIGTDPEAFAVDGEGQLLPAFSFLDDEKTALVTQGKINPNDIVPRHMPYWDGFQGEFKTSARTCLSYLVDQIQHGLHQIDKLAKKKDEKAKVVATPVLPVPPEWMQKADKVHLQFGCAPSLNAYGMAGEIPIDGRQIPVRFAGFHIHLAIKHVIQDGSEKFTYEDVVKFIDKITGVASVAALQGLEDPVRRLHYGLAGEYRTPEHGLEYRTLSSAALWHPAVTHLMFNLTRAAYQIYVKGLQNLYVGDEKEVVEIINNLDVKGAKKLIKKNRDLFAGILDGVYGVESLSHLKTLQSVYTPLNLVDHLLMPGVKEYIDLDISKNWRFDNWVTHSDGAEENFSSWSREVAKKHFPKPKVKVVEEPVVEAKQKKAA